MAGVPGCKISISHPEGVLLLFDTKIYRISAIKKAAHKFGNQFHCLISTRDDASIEVVLKPKAPLDNLEYLAGEFCNEALDQDLREVIAEQTDAVRNLLLAHAFSRTSLVNAELDTVDYHADPLGIGVTKAANE
jgi:His-Xaa-Ser system protein HxsD